MVSQLWSYNLYEDISVYTDILQTFSISHIFKGQFSEFQIHEQQTTVTNACDITYKYKFSINNRYAWEWPTSQRTLWDVSRLSEKPSLATTVQGVYCIRTLTATCFGPHWPLSSGTNNIIYKEVIILTTDPLSVIQIALCTLLGKCYPCSDRQTTDPL
jgi:hypothetical protein